MTGITPLQEVAHIARLICIEAPGKRSGETRVSRNLLDRLELALNRAGLGVDEARRLYRKQKRLDSARRRMVIDAAAVAKYPPGTRVRIDLYATIKAGDPPRLSRGVVSISNNKLQQDQVYVTWDAYPASAISAHSLELE